MDTSFISPLDDQGAPSKEAINKAGTNTGGEEEVFISDECGDSLWNEVLMEQEKKKRPINDNINKNPEEPALKMSALPGKS